MKGLKGKAQMRAPPDGALRFIERGKVHALVQHLTLLPAVESRQTVEKGGFTHAGIADDGDEFASCDLAADLLEDGGPGLSFAIAFGQIADLQQWMGVGGVGGSHAAILTMGGCWRGS